VGIFNPAGSPVVFKPVGRFIEAVATTDAAVLVPAVPVAAIAAEVGPATPSAPVTTAAATIRCRVNIGSSFL
jgi:hypothetical protein